MVEIHETTVEIPLSTETNQTAKVMVAEMIVSTTQDTLEQLKKRGLDCRYFFPAGPIRKGLIQLYSIEDTPKARRLE